MQQLGVCVCVLCIFRSIERLSNLALKLICKHTRLYLTFALHSSIYSELFRPTDFELQRQSICKICWIFFKNIFMLEKNLIGTQCIKRCGFTLALCWKKIIDVSKISIIMNFFYVFFNAWMYNNQILTNSFSFVFQVSTREPISCWM